MRDFQLSRAGVFNLRSSCSEICLGGRLDSCAIPDDVMFMHAVSVAPGIATSTVLMEREATGSPPIIQSIDSARHAL